MISVQLEKTGYKKCFIGKSEVDFVPFKILLIDNAVCLSFNKKKLNLKKIINFFDKKKICGN